MTSSERAAYDLGIRAAIDAARIVAITIECADDASTFRKRVTAEALAAFAEAAEGLKLGPGRGAASSSEPEKT
ncbi:MULTISPECIES: hypothetical protein [Methylobacterium]|jgi:hypothetical protein|uniref:Uncharacterized protein n=1 Tax=Methylobacterium goesingense TaxID=243690 RepID=A0ABV2LBZ4_9HYPH|nr:MULTISPECIES: hypothetical protein [Methylobacterium]MCJ2045573.1 hypothetical protein [Methylobacterium sp. J-078]GJD73880.1 hypothetical protein CFIICLFH_2110 [Methylobacterium goesingense]